MIRSLPIRIRLTLWFSLIIALTIGVVSAVGYEALYIELHAAQDDSLRLAANQTLANIVKVENSYLLSITLSEDDESVEGNLSHEAQEAAARLSNRSSIRLFDNDLEVFDSFGPTDPLSEPTKPKHGEYRTVITDPVHYRTYSINLPEGAGWLQITEPLDDIMATLARIRTLIAISFPLALGFAGLGGYFLVGRALRPVDHVTRLARAISTDDLGKRLRLDVPDDEIGRLADTFDDMLSRLETGFLRERTFSSDVAHELRTPLTVMKGQAEVALKGNRSSEEYKQTLERLTSETDRLVVLVEKLLMLARYEMHGVEFEKEHIDMGEMVKATLEQLTETADNKQVRITQRISSGCYIAGDTSALIQLLLNVIQNAIKFTPQGGVIDVTVSGVAGTTVLSVSDSGPGISSEHMEHVFDRFYQADPSRAREGGLGLGLAISNEIARAHNGRLSITTDQKQKGTTVTLTLPTWGSGPRSDQ